MSAYWECRLLFAVSVLLEVCLRCRHLTAINLIDCLINVLVCSLIKSVDEVKI